ncbi:hypothetical protein SAMN05216602_0570 [Pseudomonas argentinensis]|uniref:Uncharacterized protein n=1 Tax=Phytopseudomonas argentinensis TaxID=289370 RepID=A0A1I3H305_9GAMM|nr:hypothetical protein SAMN05216602_0570 [Pseudomonas argentinensis]
MWSIFFPGFVLLLTTITCTAIWLIDGLCDGTPPNSANSDEHNGPHDPFF